MSRHDIDLGEGRRLVVGWDQPLQTYFAIRYDTPDTNAAPSMWLGAGPDERWSSTSSSPLYDLEDLERALGPKAALLSPELKRELYLDRDEGR